LLLTLHCTESGSVGIGVIKRVGVAPGGALLSVTNRSWVHFAHFLIGLDFRPDLVWSSLGWRFFLYPVTNP
jgi:hypothetical protein